MSIETLTRDVADLKRRVDLAETKLSQQTGQFEFITRQQRDVQLYMHGRFADVDQRLDTLESKVDGLGAKVDGLGARFDGFESKVDALPRVIAEIIAPR